MQNITLESADKTAQAGEQEGEEEGRRDRGDGGGKGEGGPSIIHSKTNTGEGEKAAADRRWRLPNKQTASVTNSSINTAFTPRSHYRPINSAKERHTLQAHLSALKWPIH